MSGSQRGSGGDVAFLDPLREERRHLDPHVRTEMEAALGGSFGDVVVHAGTASGAAAGQLGAAAFTVGRHVVFGPGRYDPASLRGRTLLAHELAHVVQQRRGGGDPDAGERLPAGALPRHAGPTETHAHDSAGKAALGHAAPVSGVAAVGVARQDKDEEKSWYQRAKEQALTVARDKAMRALGTVEGVALEGGQIVDTLLWLEGKKVDLIDEGIGYAGEAVGLDKSTTAAVKSFQGSDYKRLRAAAAEKGMVDPDTGAITVSSAVTDAFTAVEKQAKASVFADAPAETGFLTERELGQIEGSIGTQAALATVGVTEVKVVLKVLGSAGAVKAITDAYERNPEGFAHSKDFWVAVGQGALHLIGLKAATSGQKLLSLAVSIGTNVLSTGSQVVDLRTALALPAGEARDAAVKQAVAGLVKALASAVQDAISHHAMKGGNRPPSTATQKAPVTAPDASAPKPPGTAPEATASKAPAPTTATAASSPPGAIAASAPAVTLSPPLVEPAAVRPAPGKPASPTPVSAPPPAESAAAKPAAAKPAAEPTAAKPAAAPAVAAPAPKPAAAPPAKATAKPAPAAATPPVTALPQGPPASASVPEPAAAAARKPGGATTRRRTSTKPAESRRKSGTRAPARPKVGDAGKGGTKPTAAGTPVAKPTAPTRPAGRTRTTAKPGTSSALAAEPATGATPKKGAARPTTTTKPKPVSKPKAPSPPTTAAEPTTAAKPARPAKPTAAKPARPAKPATAVKPGVPGKPKTPAKPKTATSPKATVGSKAPAKPKAATKPKTTASPKPATEPKTAAKPKTASKAASAASAPAAKATATPKAPGKPRTTTRPKAPSKPKPARKPKAPSKPKATSPKKPRTKRTGVAKALGQLEYAFAKERAAIWKQKALEELALRQRTPQPPKPSPTQKKTPKPKAVKPPKGWVPGPLDWDKDNPKPWQDFGKPRLPHDLVDPIKDLSPKELAQVAKTGKMPKRLEAQIEHARIPQRVAKELVKAGVPVQDAIRLSKLTDRSNLLPTHREFHAVVDEHAKKKGPYDVLDERKRLPLGSATKEELAAIEAALKKPGVDLDSEAGKKLSGWVKDAQDRWKGPDPTPAPPSGAAPSPASPHGHGPTAPAGRDLGAVPKTGATSVPAKTAPLAPDLPSSGVPKPGDVPVPTGSHTPHPSLDGPSPHGPHPTKGGRVKGGGRLAALIAGGTYAATGDAGAALQTLNPAANITDAIARGADGFEIVRAGAKDAVSLTLPGAIVTTVWDLTAPRGGFPQNPALTKQALDAGRNPFCEQCHGPGGLLDTAAAERRRLSEMHVQVLNEEDVPSLTPQDVTQFHQLHISRTDAEQDALREYIENLQQVTP